MRSVIWDVLEKLIADHCGYHTVVTDVELYQVSQVTGKIGKFDVIGSFPPAFYYVATVGRPRRAAIAVSYTLPYVDDGNGASPVGWGDPRFPDFGQTQAFSVAPDLPGELIYPVVAGRLTITARSGVSAGDLRSALAGRVSSLDAINNNTYAATVEPFDELRSAAEVQNNVPEVATAAPDMVVRDQGGPWIAVQVL